MQTFRARGSLFDTISFTEIVFLLEPKTKEKSTTTYGKQHVVGHRIPDYVWVGNGESHVELDAYILRSENNEPNEVLAKFKALLEPQDDTGAPHPVYINVGQQYIGKQYVLVDFESETVTYDFDDTMKPMELKIKLKLEQLPAANTGAKL